MIPKRVFLLLHIVGAVLLAGIVCVSFFFVFFPNQGLDRVQKCVLEHPLNCMNSTVSVDSRGATEISLTVQNLDRRAISIENISISSKSLDSDCTSRNINKSAPLTIKKKESKKIVIESSGVQGKCIFSKSGTSRTKFNVKITAHYDPDFPKKLSGHLISLSGRNG